MKSLTNLLACSLSAEPAEFSPLSPALPMSRLWRTVKGHWLMMVAAASVLGIQAQTVDSVITNRLAEPYGLTVETGVYYISDTANDRIVRFVPDTGAFTTLAGFAGRPGSADGKGVYARFFSPRGVVSVPARGGLVVADYANHTLRLVKLDGTVTTLAGTAGVPGFELGVTSAGAAHFNFPSALAVDATGNVYVADSKNNAIRMLSVADTVTTVITGLNEPGGVAVGDNGDLWIADSRSHVIRRLASGGAIQLAAGIPGQSGAVDSIFSDETLFNNPTALLWLGTANGLLVCDTGNHTLRRVYFDPEIGGYSVETFAGCPTQPGFVDGPRLSAKFNAPSGLTKDPAGGFLITDLANHAIRRIQTSKPQPPVREPVIGYVVFVKDQFGELLSSLVPVSQAVFNNDVIIAILPEAATETYFTYGATPPSALEDTIPSPSRLTGNSPPPYQNGLHPEQVAPSIISPEPDVTIKAIGSQDGRRPSSVVQARFQFKTANPAILGDNPASFVLTNITLNADMWYTTDGSDPVFNSPNSTRASSGPVSLPRSASPITFRVRAFRSDYKPSEIVSKVFMPEDFRANRISFGFETGEASSDFVASAGQTFFAPVTLSLLPDQKMYTLQFNVTVAATNGAPPVVPGKVGFQSMLKWNIREDIYVTIPPALFLAGASVPENIQNPPFFGDLQVTNPSINLLAVGWLERAGMTNLYDTKKQDLITYSIAHDNVFQSKGQRVVVGGYTFVVPTNAAIGSTYDIKLDRPSATSDGVGRDVYLEPVTDGTLTSTPTNRINSIKRVTVGQRRYIAGDAAPFRWFNAGDFGEGLLLNNDVAQVFQSAIYFLDYPPRGSDFYDAMDSSDGAMNGLFFGDDTSINQVQFGDGYLNVDDVYVTFRRSLDPTLTWYARYWEGGRLVAEATNNVFRASPDLPGERFAWSQADIGGLNFIAGEPSATLQLDDLQVQPGQALQIPVRSRVIGSYPLRVLMLNLTVEPLDGSPALAQPVEFVPVSALGDSTLNVSRGAHNFAGAWLNNKVPGVAGDSVIGHLKIVVPSDAPSSAAYRVHFDHASASPNGLTLFPTQLQDGLLTLDDRSLSSVGDAIPDSWRLRYFGTTSSLLALAEADADGDGVSNFHEFRAGTNPVDGRSRLRVAAARVGAFSARPFTLRWPTALNKTYAVEAAPSICGEDWAVLKTGLIGTGQDLEFTPSEIPAGAQFFRVIVSE
ncbi:MAG: FN3 associated domain-containing protein [Verrucomicrobiia bacterium]